MTDTLFGVDERLKDVEEMLFEMSTDDFIENEIESQLQDTLFNTSESKRNYVELYLEKYKYLCMVYNDDDEMLSDLEENKNIFLSNIVDKIASTFSFEIDEDEINNKVARTLYNFFVMNYAENLQEFFLNFINKNKKSLLNEIKNSKTKTRDVTTIAAKAKYYNINDAMIINNISTILMKLIPNYPLGNDFIDYILDYDDCVVNNKLSKFIKEGIITFDETYEAFLTPFIDRHDNFSTVISNITMELAKQIKQNEISIF